MGVLPRELSHGPPARGQGPSSEPPRAALPAEPTVAAVPRLTLGRLGSGRGEDGDRLGAVAGAAVERKELAVRRHDRDQVADQLVRWLGVSKLPNFSLPNLLAGRTLVPEFVQQQVRADVLGPAVLGALDGTGLTPGWYDAFADIHRQLRCDASASAAREVLALVRGSR